MIIVQENRTPDNLFGTCAPSGGLCSGQDDFEPGVDIQDWGYIGSTTHVLLHTRWGQTRSIRITPMPQGSQRCVI